MTAPGVVAGLLRAASPLSTSCPCPVDCCVPDPNNGEDETALFERAKAIHPDKADEIELSSETSRFRHD